MAEIQVSQAGAQVIAADTQKATQLVAAATDFREFLRYWHFIDQERMEVRKLGEDLWPSQEAFVRAAKQHQFLYGLKARKLGWTTIEQAYDAWVVRFRDPYARVHLFSRREKAAKEILDAVKFGLKRLPVWMQLPVGDTDNAFEFTLNASHYVGEEYVEEIRRVIAYPADENTAVEATCTHGHVDEWARMRNPRKVWQAVEASMAGTCHIITTGQGPQNWSSEFWRKTLSGDTQFHGLFVDALQRPGRTPAWLAAKRREDPTGSRQEYPMVWEDALSGGGEYVFQSQLLDRAIEDALGPSPARAGRRYVKAWDIGRHQDAAVGIVLDITDAIHDVVHYERMRELTYPELQRRILRVHALYPGVTWIEKNAAGEAVMENLDLPAHEVSGWNTGPASKARMLEHLGNALENEALRWDDNAWPQLTVEMRGYQLPDTSIVQDSVITLAIAEEVSTVQPRRGRVLRVMSV